MFMRTLKLMSVAVVAAALAVEAAPAAAAPTVVPCGTALNTLYTSSDYLELVGTRVTSRGSFGFSSFTMANGYSLSSWPLNTPGAATRSVFYAYKGASSNFEGLYSEVFPGRGNNDVDQWDFWVYSSGALYLKSTTWGGSWAALQGVVCYAGPQHQIIVTGYFDTPGYGTDFWNFVIAGLILG
jgi:hypothetical protein